jgi:hypothetical protein
MNISPVPWWVLPGLAAGVLLIFAGALVASCFFDDATLKTQMFTAASALGTMVVGYFFGSSEGSRRKDEAVVAAAKIATARPDQAPVAIAVNNPPEEK